MKRKRNSEHMQSYDLVLTDANGRSIRAHRALLMDKSDYFARILNDHDLHEIQLNENYLIELIHYLYNHDSDYARPHCSPTHQMAISPDLLMNRPPEDDASSAPGPAYNGASACTQSLMVPISNGDIEILMRLMVLSAKYSFRQLYRSLLNEINFKLGPATAITVYKCSCELGIKDFLETTRMMILSWLPQLQTTEEFLYLPEAAIRDIFGAEQPEIESESKLDALSAWWSHNKEANMTDLWARIMMST